MRNGISMSIGTLKFLPFFGQVAKRKKIEDNLLSEDGRH
jgi:hypothetical protein